MATITFHRATKKRARARVAISGPAGSGKTWTALSMATVLAGPGGRIAAIDTEHGSMSKYADLFTFDVVELEEFSPESYIAVIKVAQDAGYNVLVIDSASHEWSGRGGCLEQVERIAAQTKSGSTFNAWAKVSPRHTDFLEAIHAARMHVVATFRSKMDYVQAEGKVQKVGMAAITREGAEYEFDVVFEMDLSHRAVVTKSRCPALADQIFEKPGASEARTLLEWLDQGEVAGDPPKLPTRATEPPKGLDLNISVQYLCTECKKPIAPTTIKGVTWMPEKIASAAQKKYHRIVCVECASKLPKPDDAAHLEAGQADLAAAAETAAATEDEAAAMAAGAPVA